MTTLALFSSRCPGRRACHGHNNRPPAPSRNVRLPLPSDLGPANRLINRRNKRRPCDLRASNFELLASCRDSSNFKCSQRKQHTGQECKQRRCPCPGEEEKPCRQGHNNG